jgi:hypothetical protein
MKLASAGIVVRSRARHFLERLEVLRVVHRDQAGDARHARVSTANGLRSGTRRGDALGVPAERDGPVVPDVLGEGRLEEHVLRADLAVAGEAQRARVVDGGVERLVERLAGLECELFRVVRVRLVPSGLVTRVVSDDVPGRC